MKNFKLKRLLGLALIGGLTALNAQSVFAAAGQTISNTATMDYTVGGVAQPQQVSPAADFVEDNLVNFTVTWTEGNVSAVPGSTGNMLTYIVTNLSNGALDFSVAAIDAAAAVDQFNVTSIDNIFVESGATPGYQVLEDTATFIDELSNDPAGSANVTQVYVFATMPAAQPNGDLANITLTATARAGDALGATGAMGAVLTDDGATADDITLEQTVLNDPAGQVDGVKDGLNSVNGTYVIAAANLTVSKSVVTLWDPINAATNPKAIPGAYVQYVITVTNAAGGSSADLTTLGDTLLANLALDVAFVTNAGPGNPTSGVDDAFEINTTGTTRNTKGTTYCTATAGGGCTGVTGAGGSVSIDFTTLPATAIDAVAPTHTAGELKAGDSIVIKFNAIVQ